jgi:hypothetical protein|eukprot:COSAG01_NODE_5188_length_4423_cov_6.890148_2_plen_63_part_00
MGAWVQVPRAFHAGGPDVLEGIRKLVHGCSHSGSDAAVTMAPAGAEQQAGGEQQLGCEAPAY